MAPTVAISNFTFFFKLPEFRGACDHNGPSRGPDLILPCAWRFTFCVWSCFYTRARVGTLQIPSCHSSPQSPVPSLGSPVSGPQSRSMAPDHAEMGDYKPKNVLITGGAGFIGSHVTINLVKKYEDYKVVVFDKLDYCATLNNLKSIQNNLNFKFIKGDILSPDLVMYVLETEQIDTVMHFAAQTHVDNSFGNSLAFTMNNTYGTYQPQSRYHGHRHRHRHRHCHRHCHRRRSHHHHKQAHTCCWRRAEIMATSSGSSTFPPTRCTGRRLWVASMDFTRCRGSSPPTRTRRPRRARR